MGPLKALPNVGTLGVDLISLENSMATNTGKGFRRGAVRDRSQTYNPQTDQWVKRGPDGRFMDVKQDGEPFKGVRREPGGDEGGGGD